MDSKNQKNKLLEEILENRGIVSEEEANLFFYRNLPDDFSDPSLIKDIRKTCDRITEAVNKQEKIIIFGDYDVDGITGTALLYQFFKVWEYDNKIKINVDIHLPDRMKDGYGLKDKHLGLDKINKSNLIITVDNGISSNSAIDIANSKGIDVIIIDHHNIPLTLPSAYSINNPKQVDCNYPIKNLSAVGIVYKLCQILGKEVLNESNSKKFLDRYIDIVGIGTYQDLAPLNNENRYFVQKGLDTIKTIYEKENTNLTGLIELLKINNVLLDDINYNSFAFIIGPAINAAGRIADPKLAFDLLTTTDKKNANKLAAELKKVNDLRKKITQEAFLEAINIIEENEYYKNNVIILISSKWHQGIIGLISQRVTEKYKKTSIVLTNYKNIVYSGSARAYGDFDISSLFTELKDCFLYFGGHKKAGGFSIEENNITDFQNRALELTQDIVVHDDYGVEIDAFINAEDIQLIYTEVLSELEPFGEGNPLPVFAMEDAEIIYLSKSKREKDSLIKIKQNGLIVDMVAFNRVDFVEEFEVGDQVQITIKIENSNRKMTIKCMEMIKY